MLRHWLDTLKEKSGRDIDEWTAFLLKKGPAGTNERRQWLKTEHGLGSNSASCIVDYAEGRDDLAEADPQKYVAKAAEYVEAMFAGPKAALSPLYDKLYDLCRSLGKEIQISPGKTIISIYRHHVIAHVKPSTRTRIDFGLALKDTPAKGRLIDTGGLAKKDRITRRIEIAKLADVDAFVETWLRKAYAMDA